MRFFVGLALDDFIREHLKEFQEQFHEEFPSVSWLPPESFFVTVKFLGNPRRARVSQLKKALTRATAQVAPFSLSLEKQGCFPEQGLARVIWVGIKDCSGMLRRFQKECDEEFSSLGIAARPDEFVPHIILGRAEVNTSKGVLRKAVEAAKLEKLSQDVEEACLVQSKLSKSGPSYRLISRASFTATVIS